MPGQAQPYDRVVQDTIEGAPEQFTVETEDGRVAVEAWGRDAVAFTARIESPNAPAPVEQTRIDVDRTGPARSLATNYEHVEARWSWGPSVYGYGTTTPRVAYTVRVPRSTAIAIEGDETDIEVAGLAARLRVDVEAGRTQVRDQAGAVRVDAEEGTVGLQGIAGDVVADMEDGEVRMEKVSGSVDLEIQEGEASLQFDSFDGGAVEAREASVTLALPAGQGVDLSTDLGEEAVLNGPMDLSGIRGDGGDYTGAVRGGGPRLRIELVEGTVTLQ